MVIKFSPQNLESSQFLLTELYEKVRSEESTLAGGSKLGAGSKALQALRETKITFGNPHNDLIRLTQRLFQDIGVELTEIRKRQMRDQFNFYYMTLTVSMQPKRGSQFTRVECGLDFGPKGKEEPIVQTIFPKSEWKEILSWGGAMNLALNGNLDWGAELNMTELEKIESLPGHIAGKIVNKNRMKVFIALPDYCYQLGRTEIAATGEGNSECFWRIEKPDLRRAQTVQFGVVFKVPKAATSIKLTGVVVVEPSFNWLLNSIRLVFEELDEKIKGLLTAKDNDRNGEERLPLGDHEEWAIMLPA